jgi:nitrogen fixation NifU-like protein
MKSEEMYTEQILDLSREPLNFGKLEGATHFGSGSNPLCGDGVKIYLVVEGGIIKDVGFEGSGCAISMASSSLITEEIKGKEIRDVLRMGEEKLLELLGIPVSGARMKCVTLGINTIKEIIQ